MTIIRAAAPWRDVAKYAIVKLPHSAREAFSRVFTLVCGHTICRKGSQGIPAKMRCTRCQEISP